MSNSSGFLNYSGYPVMYENPILTAAKAYIRAIALHYSPACTYASCGNGPKIAQSIAYIRIGPSGGERTIQTVRAVDAQADPNATISIGQDLQDTIPLRQPIIAIRAT